MTRLLRLPALPWAVLFLALAAANVQIGGTNAVARISGLRAIAEGGTLNTDAYHQWSDDWALSPNGHYYPNKAPGGVLLGAPVFALIDYPVRWLESDQRNERGQVPPPGLGELFVLNLLMQLLPFALLVLWICRRFSPLNEEPAALHFFALAALFGNTAALYMGVYFGHGLAALLTLGGFACWLRGRYGAAAALLSASLLTDYGTACVIPFFVAATLWRERSARPLRAIVLGALPFAALWIWYHWTAFGSPFALAIRYSNPAMLDSAGEDAYGFFPSLTVIGELLFGTERGILFTQPWALALFPLLFVRTSLPRGTKLLLGGSLCALLWMNASFPGWHGGLVIGPRYLCLLFPSIALALALAWRDLGMLWHRALLLAAGISVAFRIFVYPFSIIGPRANLWWYYYRSYLPRPRCIYEGRCPEEVDPIPLLALAISGFLLAGAWALWTEQKEPTAAAAPSPAERP